MAGRLFQVSKPMHLLPPVLVFESSILEAAEEVTAFAT
jgi:hypothetical protein